MRNGESDKLQYLGLISKGQVVYEEYCTSPMPIEKCITKIRSCIGCEFRRLKALEEKK